MFATLTIPDHLARRLEPYESQLVEIVEIGLREVCSRGQPGYSSVNEILEMLAELPAPRDVLALRPSELLQNRLDELSEKNSRSGFTEAERHEWERYEYAEHLVRMAKIHAATKLRGSGS